MVLDKVILYCFVNPYCTQHYNDLYKCVIKLNIMYAIITHAYNYKHIRQSGYNS